MDQETIELVRHLCCRAGMIMENASPSAIAAPKGGEDLRAAVSGLTVEVDRARALLAAADALIY